MLKGYGQALEQERGFLWLWRDYSDAATDLPHQLDSHGIPCSLKHILHIPCSCSCLDDNGTEHRAVQLAYFVFLCRGA